MLRLLNLAIGLVLFAAGIVLMLKANIGYSPWDVFHDGFAGIAGITFGTASIVVGAAVLAVVIVFKEKIGLGTVANMLAVGPIIDFIARFIPLAANFAWGIAMLLAGLAVLAFGSYFYMSSGFGAGPRDSLMVALMRKTKKSAGFCRTAIELSAVIIGRLLGGMVGVGTVISAFGIGICVQLVFKMLKFDAAAIEHETLAETGRRLFKN